MASVTFTPATGGDGSTVTDDSNPTTGLANGGHRTRFVPCLTQTVNTAQKAVDKAAEAAASAVASAASAASAVAAPGTTSTSTTSVTTGTGAKAFTTQTGKTYLPGMYVTISSTSGPSNWSMFGVIQNYTSGTGVLNVDVLQAVGSGTVKADWNIAISGPIFRGVINESHGGTIATAATIDLNNVTGNFIRTSGSTTVSTINLADGASRTLLILAPVTFNNSGNIGMPGNPSTMSFGVGDMVTLRGDLGGATKITSYTPYIIPGLVNGLRSTDVASAATVNLSNTTGDWVSITGTTTITGFTLPIGWRRTLYISAGLTLTHNASTLILPGGANITCAVGDMLTIRAFAANSVVVESYTRANGQSLATPKNLVVLTTTQTWSPPAGTTLIEVTVVNGGDSSVYSTGGPGTFHFAPGKGGNAGVSVLTVSPSVTYTATVGAGGATPSPGAGINIGGASSFSGSGITTLTSANAALQVAGGTGFSADVNKPKGCGSMIAPPGSNGYGTGGDSGDDGGGSTNINGKAGVVIIRY